MTEAEPGPHADAERDALGAATDAIDTTAADQLPAADHLPVADQLPARSLTTPPGPIDRQDPVRVAAAKAMWPQVERLLAADATLRVPGATPDLKRYRVASRRLRAALRAFDQGFSKREVGRLREGLAAIADAAGSVRDLDVRLANLGDWARERGGDAADAVIPLQEDWTGARAGAARQLLEHLTTHRHARLLDDLVGLVESDAHRRSEDGGRPIGLQAGSMVWLDYERLLANDTSIHWAELPALHRARIEAKRLRYLLEFLGELIGPDREPLVVRLVALQDHLGALNDAALAAAAVRAFLARPPQPFSADERRTIEAYLRDRDRTVMRLRRSVGRPWRGVTGVTFARRLARAIVRAGRPAPEPRETPQGS